MQNAKTGLIDKQDPRCANGKTGYSDSGKAYMPNPPCRIHARPGHIFCNACRVAAGGLPL
jgi:hypothetical protein